MVEGGIEVWKVEQEVRRIKSVGERAELGEEKGTGTGWSSEKDRIRFHRGSSHR